jgi:hypothetical protein
MRIEVHSTSKFQSQRSSKLVRFLTSLTVPKFATERCKEKAIYDAFGIYELEPMGLSGFRDFPFFGENPEGLMALGCCEKWSSMHVFFELIEQRCDIVRQRQHGFFMRGNNWFSLCGRGAEQSLQIGAGSQITFLAT